ncbi:MAG: hypothetical protein IPH78_05355 [Bacteroidetes bacterium]|nr:hypothetical protein [Bacteroidota bacterium]
MKTKVAGLILCLIVILYSCQPKTAEQATPAPTLVFRFEVDSAGNIVEEDVKLQLKELAVRISKTADRVILYSYTEKMNSADSSMQIASQQAYAAKNWMYQASKERIYYSVGIAIKGFENPVDSAAPESKINRRIEFQFLE